MRVKLFVEFYVCLQVARRDESMPSHVIRKKIVELKDKLIWFYRRGNNLS